jgi:lysozyme family protein
MINKFNEFLLEKEFNSIIDDIFRIVEDVEGKWISPNTIEWDYTNKEEDEEKSSLLQNTLQKGKELLDIGFQKSGDFIDKNVQKLKEFVLKLPKDKIKDYFTRLLNSLKNVPERLRRFLITHYTSVFLTVASISFLVGYGDETQVKSDPVVKQKTEVLDPKIEKEVKELVKKSSFESAQSSVKEVEAGYSDDRGDTGNFIEVTGGRRFLGTNHGISAPILQKYFQDNGIKRLPTKEDMLNLSYKTALEIYKKDYWDAQNLTNLCNQNVANIIYDGCVNQGIDGMNDVLTNALKEQGVKVKGWCFSKNNIKNLNSCNQEQLFNSIKKFRELRYKQAATWSRHGEGWMNRLSSIEYQITNQA